MNTADLPNPFFQSLHCPKGANAYFALGLLGSGGMGVETDYIPKQNVYVGLTDGKTIKCLPFFSGGSNEWLKDYMVGGVASAAVIELYRPGLRGQFLLMPTMKNFGDRDACPIEAKAMGA